MRVVLDTNILVRAHAKARGPAREILQLIAGSASHSLLLSPFLLRELERVLFYERVRAVSKLSRDEIVDYLAYLRSEAISEMVFPGPAPRIVTADADDDPVVHTAVIGRADVLRTLNRDFYDPAVLDYCRACGVAIAPDVELLALLRSAL